MSITVGDVKRLLPLYGYEPSEKDSSLIEQCIDHTLLKIRSYINNSYVYPELEPEAIRMSVGEFLYQKKRTPEGLSGGGVSFPDRVAQVTEGDTSISWTRADKEEVDFDDMVEKMRRGDYIILEHFRKVHW